MTVVSPLKTRSGQILSLSNLRQNYPEREIFAANAADARAAARR